MKYEVELLNGTKETVIADNFYVISSSPARGLSDVPHYIFSNNAAERYGSSISVAAYTYVKCVRPVPSVAALVDAQEVAA